MTTATAQARLDWINEEIANGRTVTVCTYTRTTVVTPKTFAAWARDHGGLFKVAGASLYMRSGKGWACLDFTTIKSRGR